LNAFFHFEKFASAKVYSIKNTVVISFVTNKIYAGDGRRPLAERRIRQAY
jgi:hypothetical protein